MSSPQHDVKLGGFRLAKVLVWLVYAYLIAAVIILVLAFFLQLFAASTDAEFTQWVYRAANRALEPFQGIFPSIEGESGSVLDFAVVFAIIMYGILAMVFQALVSWLDRKIYEERRRLAETPPPPTFEQPTYRSAQAPPPPAPNPGADSQVAGPERPPATAPGPAQSAPDATEPSATRAEGPPIAPHDEATQVRTEE